MPNSDYHGSYVAAAAIDLPTLGEVVLLSAHASPTALDAEASPWTGEHPTARNLEGRGGGRLWHSDYVLSSVRALVQAHRHVLVAGDFNEARRWDEIYGGTWGVDFFMAVENAGLRDLTYSAWDNREDDTRDGWQIDHAFATEELAALAGRPEVGPPWPTPDATDHRPLLLSFSLTGEAASRPTSSTRR